MKIVQCWNCGAKLCVPLDRQDRRAEEAGENTIDPHLRVCIRCWSKIKRGNVNQMPRFAAACR